MLITPRLGLKKYQLTDPFHTADQNSNMDILEKNFIDVLSQSALTDVAKITSELVYDEGVLIQVNDTNTDSGILVRKTDLSYTSDDLTPIRVRLYASNGTTVIRDYIDTLNYASGVLNTITRVVNV